jgi:hypothetical protein
MSESANQRHRKLDPITKDVANWAALLPDYAALFTHERVVSVDLASKSCPAGGDISQNLGFMLALR